MVGVSDGLTVAQDRVADFEIAERDLVGLRNTLTGGYTAGKFERPLQPPSGCTMIATLSRGLTRMYIG